MTHALRAVIPENVNSTLFFFCFLFVFVISELSKLSFQAYKSYYSLSGPQRIGTEFSGVVHLWFHLLTQLCFVSWFEIRPLFPVKTLPNSAAEAVFSFEATVNCTEAVALTITTTIQPSYSSPFGLTVTPQLFFFISVHNYTHPFVADWGVWVAVKCSYISRHKSMALYWWRQKKKQKLPCVVKL